MRPLTADEIVRVRQLVVQPLWLTAAGVLAVLIGIAVYDGLKDSLEGDWRLWLGLSPFLVIPLLAVLKAGRIGTELASGAAETVAGTLERSWTEQHWGWGRRKETRHYIQVAGQKFQLGAETRVMARLVEGQALVVDYLPRCRLTLTVTETGPAS
jgi:hypothetical protein